MSSIKKSLLSCGELGSYELANMCGLVPDSTKVLSLMSLQTHPDENNDDNGDDDAAFTSENKESDSNF